MSNAQSDLRRQSSKRRTNLSWLLYLMLALTGVIATAVIWKLNQAAIDLKTELAFLTADTEGLNSQIKDLESRKNELAEVEKQSDLWKQQLLDIYRQYRTVEDFAPNPSKFIICYGNSMSGTKRFSTPHGQHTLKVDVSKINPDSKEVINEETFSFDLIGNAAYVLQLDHSNASFKKPAPLKLLLTSNAEGFKNISKDIVDPFPSHKGRQSGFSNSIVSFPNEISRHLLMNRWKDAIGKGNVLADFMWSIESSNQTPFNLKFKYRIVSEGPYVVESGTTYEGMYRVEYLQGGMYEVIKNIE